jgi:AAA domain-containing protein
LFKEVTRQQNRLRLAIDGVTGGGKTFTALRFAFALAGPEGKVAVIDTEHNSAAKYEGEVQDGITWKWKGVNLEHFGPATYEAAIVEAGRQGFDVLVIDSLSHAWMGVGGALDQIDHASGNKFTAWRDVTPQHNSMIEAILRSPCHVIATMRSKMEYVLELDEKGKQVPAKVGMKPIQRDGVEYEFDIVAEIDLGHTFKVSKTRCSEVDGRVINRPGANFIEPVKRWLFSGSPAAAPVAADREAMVPMTSTSAPNVPANGNGVTLGPRCDEFLAGEIKKLAADAGVPPEALRAAIAKRGAGRLLELSRDDAMGLRGNLQKRLLEKEGAEAF